MALVVGSAVAAAVGRGDLNYPSGLIARGQAPSWFIAASTVARVLGLSGLALAPAVVLRKVRYGGAIGAAQFLPLAYGIGPLLVAVRGWPTFGAWALGPNFQYPGEPTYRLWMSAELGLAALAIAGLWARRGRPRGLVDGLLLLIVWVGLDQDAMGFYMERINGLVAGLVQSRMSRTLSVLLLLIWPGQVVGYLPLAAATTATLLRDRPSWTWLEWAGFLAIGPLEILSLVLEHAESWLSGMGSLLLPFNALMLTTCLVGFASSLGLIRLARPAWRWFWGTPTLDPGAGRGPGVI